MVCFRRGIRTERIRKSQRRSVNRSGSTACSADVQLGGASGGTEVHQDEPGDRRGSQGYHNMDSEPFGNNFTCNRQIILSLLVQLPIAYAQIALEAM